MTTTPRRSVLGAWLLAAALAGSACSAGSSSSSTSSSSPARGAVPVPTTGAAPAHPRGGSARVGVWGEPDPDGSTLGAAAVRALVLPQLFVAGPDGTWMPSLVVPGSDKTGSDGRSAQLRLRAGAAWSDGSPITADDLRRSADSRFVAGVDGPGPDGVLTLRFTQSLPGWRRLWSATDVVTAPRPGVFGGPFVLRQYVPGLEAVLAANEGWYGGRPFLDEVRLVLVPDVVIARRLLATGELDVVMPPASTVRTRQLEALSGVSVSVAPPATASTASSARAGGWWVGLLLRPDRLGPVQRAAVVASVDRDTFVGTLLRDEAAVVRDFDSGDGERVWGRVVAGSSTALRGVTVDLVGELEEPMTATLERSMQKHAHPGGGRLELRNAEADRVERWVAEGSYQAAIVAQFDSPAPCWTCRWASVDEALARAADAGERGAVRSLEARLRDEALFLPLWRPTPVVAARNGLHGTQANPFALSGAWNSWEWWRDGANS
ncbi:MAG TPA: ABC transporter substrate-binding protein [Acidimicrobiales bacterium]|nr:ABC transporter substrate-binding protein [Acidimicrobiales bacterium]